MTSTSSASFYLCFPLRQGGLPEDRLSPLPAGDPTKRVRASRPWPSPFPPPGPLLLPLGACRARPSTGRSPSVFLGAPPLRNHPKEHLPHALVPHPAPPPGISHRVARCHASAACPHPRCAHRGAWHRRVTGVFLPGPSHSDIGGSPSTRDMGRDVRDQDGKALACSGLRLRGRASRDSDRASWKPPPASAGRGPAACQTRVRNPPTRQEGGPGEMKARPRASP